MCGCPHFSSASSESKLPGVSLGTLYTSIKEDLLVKIKNGTYAEGDVIPSEVDLAKEYGVSRPTIRQALHILTSEGYLDRRKRRGTIVADPNADRRRQREVPDFGVRKIKGVQSFEDELAWAGKKVDTMPILVKGESATSEVAKGLDVREGDLVYKLVRLRYVDGTPNMFTENYIPASLYPGFIDNVDFSKKRLYGRMREMGRPVVTVYRRIDVVKADSSISMLLDVAIGDPMFLLHTSGRDAEGNIVEYSVSTYKGSANTFEFSVSDDTLGVQDDSGAHVDVKSVMYNEEQMLG